MANDSKHAFARSRSHAVTYARTHAAGFLPSAIAIHHAHHSLWYACPHSQSAHASSAPQRAELPLPLNIRLLLSVLSPLPTPS
eukprot:4051218-Pleurochrysis_carterae.AAC.2